MNDIETWKDIPGYENLYQVSNKGRVKSYDRKFHPGKILKPWSHKHGYPMVALYKNKGHKNKTIHSLVMLTFRGPRPNGQEVMHLNNDPNNAELINLAYGSPTCNSAFTIDHGTVPPGSRKLTLTQVNRIREYASVGVKRQNLANTFKISLSTVYRVIGGKTWAV